MFQEYEEGGGGGGGGGEEQYHAIELNRGSRGFGFSIRGGREFSNMALFVLQIAENGPAALDGHLKVSVCFTGGESDKIVNGRFNFYHWFNTYH